MPRVLLATCADLPRGEPGGESLVDAFARRGVSAQWARWDDPEVDWCAAGLVAVRSTWDYDTRIEEFSAWVRRIEGAGATVLNGSAAFAWNTDKAYLAALGRAGVAVVPTLVVDDEAGLGEAVRAYGRAVVKPRTAAGGRGVVVVDADASRGRSVLGDAERRQGPWVVQPLVESVRTEGEWSVFVLGGRVVSGVRKLPAGAEIRVHEEYGGHTVAAVVGAEQAALALAAVAGAERAFGCRLPYARVDQLRLAAATMAVSELEVTEPGLYLDHLPGNADAFAAMVLDELG